MAVSLKHAFQSTVPDEGDTSLVRPSNWNAEHQLTLDSGKLVGRSTTGTGAAEEISVGTGLALSGGTLSATGGVAGSTTQVQFNDAGALAGDAGLTFDKTAKALTVGGGTVTTSQPVAAFSQTWNAAAVTFTGLRLNVTDTASASGSLLMDLQVGGANRFSVDKVGLINTPFLQSTASFALVAKGTVGGISAFNGSLTLEYARMNTSGVQLLNGATLSFAAGGSGTVDLILTRRAAANIRLGAADAAAPVAQTLSVQSVVAGTSNTAGANLTITGSQGTGTGAGGSIIFQVAPAGSSGTAQNALATALTIASDQSATFSQSVRSSTPFPRYGGSSGIVLAAGSTDLVAAVNNITTFQSGAVVGWSSGLATSAQDVSLARDAANTLALRNGTNAQTKRIYGTFTDASNYRRVAIGMTTAGVASIKPEGAGTGASGNVLHISGLPTSNPGPGILWNDAGTVKVGT